MATDDNTKKERATEEPEVFQGYILNEHGEEVPITEDMMAESFAKIKLKSIGAHTGYTKAVTDDMLPTTSDKD